MAKVYFETKEEAEMFKACQNCRVSIFYCTKVSAFYVIASMRQTFLYIHLPNLKILTNSQNIFNEYCLVLEILMDINKNNGISRFEKDFLLVFINKFKKFVKEIRER